MRFLIFLNSEKGKEHGITKFGDNLKDVNLISDSVTHLEAFWDAINTALKSTLVTPTLLPDYIQLTSFAKDKATHCLLPPTSHLDYSEALANFNLLGSILKTHLIKPSTITSPKALEKLTINKFESNGFDILTNIIYEVSPMGRYHI